MYSLHDVEVTGVPLKEILECEIESMIGEHSTLRVSAYVDEENELYELPDCQEVRVLLRDGKEKKIIFSGIVTNISLSTQGQMRVARIEGKSRSWLMDRTKHSRSFQDANMSYSALIQEVMKSYENCDFIYAGAEQPIERLIIQYEETDWDFLKRVVSLVGYTLTPDSRQDGLKFYVGVPTLAETEVSYRIQEMEKDMNSFYLLKENNQNVHTEDFTCYRIASEQLLGIFDPVTVQGKPLVAYSCGYYLNGQEMTGIYRLQSREGLKSIAVYPMHLIGVALMGKVVNVSGSKIQASMEIDKGHAERAVYWFPYSTISASTDGSGWYCMPENGDDVRIYFPSKQEKEAVALSAVSSYAAPEGGGEDRMADPNSRYLKTKSGQELALAPGFMRLSCGQGAALATIRSSGRVTVQAQTMVKVEAQEELLLCAEEAVNIHVKEQFIAQNLDGGQIISSEGDILLRGTEVKFD